ncbi:DUF554 domain-containing protein [Robbsia sp. Bb-Pol-6]|uniref:DUF554 domain-containing protein n=1 Tax=Robbsia betulipollinis TaxID=2981849 RepID=A0ABT3ZJE3_9BURK|nr:DUF554 domain-containing protein [Robbsia betulipollinis]
MIIGPYVDAGSVLTGGLAGAAIGVHLPKPLRSTMTSIFGLCSMCMGLLAIMKDATLPVMVLAVILGTLIGELIFLERGIGVIGKHVDILMNRLLPSSGHGGVSGEAFLEQFVAIIVLFCASGTGIFGAMHEGMTGDASILIAKSILDLFTAAFFAAALGYAVATVALPQLAILLILAYLGGYIVPLTNATMQSDFFAVGGVLMFATGLRICGIKSFPVASMLPALVIVMPLSLLWGRLI